MSKFAQQDWSLSFGELEAVLSEMNGVLRSRSSTFQARLKNLLKVGFLPHVASGRGKAGRYHAGDIFQFAVAAELMHFNLGPHGVVGMMFRLDEVMAAAALESSEIIDGEVRVAPNDEQLYVVFDPGGMAEMRREWGDPELPTEMVVRGDLSAAKFRTRLAVVNVSRLILNIADALEVNELCEREEFAALLTAWAFAQRDERQP